MAKRLTDTTIAQMKPGATRREIADAGCPGLYLCVHPTGARSWALRYRAPNVRGADRQRVARKLTLDAEGVAQARAMASAAVLQIKKGIDPAIELRDEKAKQKAEIHALPDTIDAALIEFMTHYKGKKAAGLRASTLAQRAEYFGLRADGTGGWTKTGSGVLAVWSARPLPSITRRDVRELVRHINAQGHGVTSNRTLSALKTFFLWCMKEELLEASPAALVDPPAVEITRDRVLSDAELAAAWRAAVADKYIGSLVQLLILTGCRRDELREATWDEFDLVAGTFSLPDSRTKNGVAHLIPLPATAIKILESLPRIKGAGLVFTTNGYKPINGLDRAKRRLDAAMLAELGALPEWTLHDLRRTFATGLQRLGFPIAVVESALNHKSGTVSGVAAIYARHDYLPEKTKALAAWADHIAGLVTGKSAPANVVPLRGAKA
jgi:integrase